MGCCSVAILAAAMAATALGYVPVAVFFAAAGLTIPFPLVRCRCAKSHHIEWPILVMLGALIPVSDALRTPGPARHRRLAGHSLRRCPWGRSSWRRRWR